MQTEKMQFLLGFDYSYRRVILSLTLFKKALLQSSKTL